MKTKHTFAIIIAVIFIAVMYFYHDTMTFLEIAGAFAANSLLITTVWQWFRAEEKAARNKFLEKRDADNQIRINNLREQNDSLFAKHYNPTNKPKASDEEL